MTIISGVLYYIIIIIIIIIIILYMHFVLFSALFIIGAILSNLHLTIIYPHYGYVYPEARVSYIINYSKLICRHYNMTIIICLNNTSTVRNST